MKFRLHGSEKGQAIVYLVLGFVVFLGFVALAIDGGMALANRRHAQNAADAASLAGGGQAADVLQHGPDICIYDWTCQSNSSNAIAQAYTSAIQRAGANDFTIDHDVSDHNGVLVTCSDANPKNKYIQVTVDISATTTSNFLQLIYPQALQNQVQAVTRVFPTQPVGYDAAVIALNPGNCQGDNGISVSGNGEITVSGGGMFSNGCVQGGGTPASALVMTGTIEYNPPYLEMQNTSFSPAPQPSNGVLQPTDFLIPAPKLDGAGNCIGGNNVAKLPKNMSPGLYCLKGSDTISQDTTGIGVTIFLQSGHLTVNGGAKVDLEAPTAGNLVPPAIKGLLIYAANGANVTVNGDSQDTFKGLIYAPTSPSIITLNGTANAKFEGQMIGWNVKINGNVAMEVTYSGCEGYQKPTSLELYK